jgi:hypothetical protein
VSLGGACGEQQNAKAAKTQDSLRVPRVLR